MELPAMADTMVEIAALFWLHTSSLSSLMNNSVTTAKAAVTLIQEQPLIMPCALLICWLALTRMAGTWLPATEWSRIRMVFSLGATSAQVQKRSCDEAGACKQRLLLVSRQAHPCEEALVDAPLSDSHIAICQFPIWKNLLTQRCVRLCKSKMVLVPMRTAAWTLTGQQHVLFGSATDALMALPSFCSIASAWRWLPVGTRCSLRTQRPRVSLTGSVFMTATLPALPSASLTRLATVLACLSSSPAMASGTASSSCHSHGDSQTV